MIDNYNRKINYLRISVTDRCNLRCQYCRPKEGISLLGHEDILSYEEILRIVSVATELGITKVRVTGGEPLIRRGIIDFVRELSSISGLKDISLTTNGLLLGEYAAPLYEAGIRRINISIDSLKEKKYAAITGGGDFRVLWQGIEAALKEGFYPIKLNTVVIKGVNDDEILDFAALSLKYPFQMRFIELMPIGQAGIQYEHRFLSNDILWERINRTYSLEPVDRGTETDGPARIFRIPGGMGEIGFISPISHHFCNACNRIRLTSDGHFRPCLLKDREIDLKTMLRQGCSDRELKEVLLGAISAKPQKHEIDPSENQVKKCVKEMVSLGG